MKNIGVHTLDQLHQVAKSDTPRGYATGGLIGGKVDNSLNGIVASGNGINAVNRFTRSTDRQALSDASIIHVSASNTTSDSTRAFDNSAIRSITTAIKSGFNDSTKRNDISKSSVANVASIQSLTRNMQLDRIGKSRETTSDLSKVVSSSIINAADRFSQKYSSHSSAEFANVANLRNLANFSMVGIRELEGNMIRQEEILSLIEERMVSGSDVNPFEAPAVMQSSSHSETRSESEELIQVIREIMSETKTGSDRASPTDYGKKAYDLLERITLGGTSIRTTPV